MLTLPASDPLAKSLKAVRHNARAATLPLLKTIYMGRGLTPASLSQLIGPDIVSRKRIQELANATSNAEPYLDEAYQLHHALGTGGINQLMSLSGTLAGIPMGVALDADLDAFRTKGLRIGLSLACRIAVRFGLDDPAELIVTPLHRQIWDTLASGERSDAPGACPWCLGASGNHLPTCLPHNLWGPRDIIDLADLGMIPRVQGPGSRQASSGLGFGLKDLRTKRLGKTQKQFAADIRLSDTYYPRVERCELALTQDIAERIAAVYRIDIALLYKRPEGQGLGAAQLEQQAMGA